LRYNYTIVKAPADYGSTDELQRFLNELNASEGEIVSVTPIGNRYILIIYKS
jgi:hypothetical protein